ncbi:MAG: hypothetical protein IJ912_07230 [Fibrobacter sp.]|nr:hypothetical protein [Fibrobacter sp.]
MKNKVFIAMTAAVAMAALTACGDSSGSSDPTKAEACAQGVSDECLDGTWDLIGIATNQTGEIYPYANYSANPGKLIFNKENHTLEFDLPAVGTSKVDPRDYPVKGTWTVANGIVNFHIMSTAINGTRFEMVPTVKIEGAFVKLTFNRLLFLIPEVDDSPFDANTEVFTISAN